MAPAPAVNHPGVWDARSKQPKPRKISSSPTLQDMRESTSRAGGELQGNPSQPELRPRKYQPLLPREEKMDRHKGDTGDLSYFLRETGPVLKESPRRSRTATSPNNLVRRVFRSSQQATNAPSSTAQENDSYIHFKPQGTIQKTSLAGKFSHFKGLAHIYSDSL